MENQKAPDTHVELCRIRRPAFSDDIYFEIPLAVWDQLTDQAKGQVLSSVILRSSAVLKVK